MKTILSIFLILSVLVCSGQSNFFWSYNTTDDNPKPTITSFEVISENQINFQIRVTDITSPLPCEIGLCYFNGYSETTKIPTYDDTKYISVNVYVPGEQNRFAQAVPNYNIPRYYRAYAKNSNGIFYSPLLMINTAGYTASVATNDAANITTNSAVVGGTISSSNSIITNKGIKWGYDSSVPNSISAGSGNDSYSFEMAGFDENTTVYYQAFITAGTTITGTIKSFTTIITPTLAIVGTNGAINHTPTSVDVNVHVISDGGTPVIERGLCYSLSGTPEISDFSITSGTGEGIFMVEISGLTPNTTYYARGYAINSIGLSYSVNTISFTTPGIPTCTGSCPMSSFFHEITSSCGGPYTFSGSLVLAQEACDEWNDISCTTKGMGGQSFRYNSLAVGQQLFDDVSPYAAETVTGYFLEITGGSKIIHVNNGIIQSITSCP